MNIEKYKAKNELSNGDIVELIQPEFPRFRKEQVTMVTKQTYGVTLAPEAVKILYEAHPQKENRTKANRITLWMTEVEYAALLSYCEERNMTRQDVAEKALRWFLFDFYGATSNYTAKTTGLRRIDSHELNLKPRKEME